MIAYSEKQRRMYHLTTNNIHDPPPPARNIHDPPAWHSTEEQSKKKPWHRVAGGANMNTRGVHDHLVWTIVLGPDRTGG
jgi:hypothetical protein